MRLGYWLVKLLVYGLIKTFWGLKVTGTEMVPKTGPVIIASNHISFLDPPVLGAAIPRECHFAAKEQLFKNKIVGSAISYLNAFPVKRGGFDNAALKKSLNALEKQGTLIMFPEGTRSRTGKMLPFKRGIGYVVSKTRPVVVPVYIYGSNKLKERLFKRGGVIMQVGEPLTGLADKFPGKEGFDQIAEEVRKAIVKLEERVSK